MSNLRKDQCHFAIRVYEPSSPWSYGSWIYNYIYSQCRSPLTLWVRISIRASCTTLCDKACQWLATGWWFSPGTPVSYTNRTAWPPRYSWNIVESGVKHHIPIQIQLGGYINDVKFYREKWIELKDEKKISLTLQLSPKKYDNIFFYI